MINPAFLSDPRDTGRLEAGPGPRGRGFRVHATVPLRAVTAPVPKEASAGTVLP